MSKLSICAADSEPARAARIANATTRTRKIHLSHLNISGEEHCLTLTEESEDIVDMCPMG